MNETFYSGSMQAAATLLGLLFVAVAVDPERTVGAGAPQERSIAAESAFTALVDAFLVSMGGTITNLDLGAVLLVVSVLALSQSLYAATRVLSPRSGRRVVVQRMVLVAVALAIYGLQLGDAYELLRVPSSTAPGEHEIVVFFALYAYALVRSWELLGGRPGVLPRRSKPADAGVERGATDHGPRVEVPSGGR